MAGLLLRLSVDHVHQCKYMYMVVGCVVEVVPSQREFIYYYVMCESTAGNFWEG